MRIAGDQVCEGALYCAVFPKSLALLTGVGSFCHTIFWSQAQSMSVITALSVDGAPLLVVFTLS